MKYIFFILFVLFLSDGFGQTVVDGGSTLSTSFSTSLTGPSGAGSYSNTVILMLISTYGSPAVEPSSVTTNSGMTFTKLSSVAVGTNRRSTYYIGSGNFNSGGVTVTWASNQASKYMFVVRITDVPLGNNGLDAIRQYKIISNNQANPSATFDSAPVNNSTVTLIHGDAYPYSWSLEDASWSILRSTNTNNFAQFIASLYSTGNDQTPSIIGNAMNYAQGSFELQASSPATRRRIIQSN